jgi:hypothetical protein
MPSISTTLAQIQREKFLETQEQKPKPKLARVDPLPKLHMEELVEWYFCKGQSAFERSVTGSIIDAAELGDYTSRPCKNCGGSGVFGDIESMRTNLVKWQEEDKKPLRTHILEFFRDCPACHGTGVIERRRARWFLKFSADAPFEPLNAIDVHPRKQHESGTRGPPDDTVLTRYAVVCRRLQYVPKWERQIIGAGYGPWGSGWAETTYGREWAVIPFTVVGMALLACPGLATDKGTAAQLDSIGAMSHNGTLNQDDSKLLRRALTTSRRALRHSILVWNSIFMPGEL